MRAGNGGGSEGRKWRWKVIDAGSEGRKCGVEVKDASGGRKCVWKFGRK